ncbi:hypothetical protein BRARA_I04493 [Brassica rapa]|uniref:F-box protein n=1 Tax=Brassica campestris TaxID=3711 RepID=A0A397YB77_BRACM|nr:hypothetical protein BRARA_I04493 [Brassica rapa]
MSPSASVIVARVLFSTAAMRQNPLKRKRDDEITVHEEDDVHEHTKPRPPSWEALCVLGPYMDPQTLAVASCVSTTWLECFSSDDLWKALLTARSSQRSSPYEIVLKNTDNISCKHLVFAVEMDAKRRRKDQVVEPVKISLCHTNLHRVDGLASKSSFNVVIHGNEIQYNIVRKQYFMKRNSSNKRKCWWMNSFNQSKTLKS